MIGLISASGLPLINAAVGVSALAMADQRFARLAGDFFKGQGLMADISPQDRFVRVTMPLAGAEDPHGFLRTLGNAQGLLQDRARLVHIEKNDANLIAHLGFPFPSLLVGLLGALYGPQAMTPVFLSREVTRGEINRMYARNEQPVGIFEEPVFLGDVGSLVHGFIFMYHDLYHLAFGSALPLPVRRLWSALYDHVDRFPQSVRSLTVTERLLDHLTDNDIDASLVPSEGVLAFVPFRAVVNCVQEACERDDEEGSLEILRECSFLLSELLSALRKSGDGAVVSRRDGLIDQLEEIHMIVERQIAIRQFLEEGLF